MVNREGEEIWEQIEKKGKREKEEGMARERKRGGKEKKREQR